MTSSVRFSRQWIYIAIFWLACLGTGSTGARVQGRRQRAKERCPRVRALRNFSINDLMGPWYVVQYYASSEEMPEYACMRSSFAINDHLDRMYITMNFSYHYAEDPIRQPLNGNITWFMPNANVPAHWMHTEYSYTGIYNTYVIDTDYKTWALIMHCAEKAKSPKYLSALLLARQPRLPINAVNFLREKLPRYDIDTSFMFDIEQESCRNIDLQTDDKKPGQYSVHQTS